MTIAKILCPLRGDDRGEGVLEHALAIGRKYNAHIEAVYCQARSRDLLPHTDMLPGFMLEQIEQSISQSSNSEGERMRQLFGEFAAAKGIEVVDLEKPVPHDRVTLAFRTEQGRQATVLGVRGRLADLVVVTQPDPSGTLGANTLHSSLMSTGRPVLMAPPLPVPEHIGEHVAIGWNGSTEAARAVALSLDIIQRAKKVTALSIGETPYGASADELVEYLAVRGIACEHRNLPSAGDVGPALLKAANEAGADLFVMGAYSRSRGQEALFGGATYHIVHRATMPVLMTH